VIGLLVRSDAVLASMSTANVLANMSVTSIRASRLFRFAFAVVALVGLFAVFTQPTRAHARTDAAVTAPTADPVVTGEKMTNAQAVVLGVIEGVTEYLPVSSTGHLVVAERLMNLPNDGKNADAKVALDAYTVIIQFGAIIAVLVIYRRRVGQVIQGLVGKSESGRQLLLCLIAAFVPAAVVGLALGDKIDEHLLKPGPIAAAWIVGGLVILALYKRLSPSNGGGKPLEAMTAKTAFFVGCAQALALWPGTSRSLVTIVAAVLLGLSLVAAVEFSFLLGLLTLTAATGLSVMKHGKLVHDTYGTTAPLIGIVFAGLAAALAVGTFVRFLGRRDLKGFGFYRIAAGIATLALMATTTRL
jgi:undecaprenyl-diphosphatase